MFKSSVLESKYCKSRGLYEDYIVPKDVETKPYYDYPKPFRFGFVRQDQNYEFLVPNIRTQTNEFVIHTYNDLGYRVNGKIKFQNRYFFITSVNVSFEEDGFNIIEHYFLTIR